MQPVELRCETKLHGILIEPGIIEVGCSSKFCGAGKGVVVRHRLDLSTGEVISTQRYKQPLLQRKEHGDAPASTNPAVRAS
jgi:hypothetical protein